MRRTTVCTVVTAGVLSTAAAGAAVAYGSWSVSGTLRLTGIVTAPMPAFTTGPAAQLSGRRVTVKWVGLKIEKGVPVERYVVTRHDAAPGTTTGGVQVCVANSTSCKDAHVPDGRWTYTVRTVQGAWNGPESPRSTAVTVEDAARPAPAAKPAPELTAPGAVPGSPPADVPAPTRAPDVTATEEPPSPASTAEPSGTGTPPALPVEDTPPPAGE